MPKKRELEIPVEEIERSILIVRGQRVMFDSDLARMNGVATASTASCSLTNLNGPRHDTSRVSV
ncbi:MAG: hypothetical protein AB7K24_15380 [Gemmataceae bacterium]